MVRRYGKAMAVVAGLLMVVGATGAWVDSRPGSGAVDTPVVSTARVATPIRQAAAPLPMARRTLTAGLRPVDVPVDPYAAEPVHLIGALEIPKLKLVSPLYDGVTLHNIDLGPSHWPGTAMPGQPGNVVVGGHRVTRTHPFLHIDQLVPGDQVIFLIGGSRTVYLVTSHEVVAPTAMWIVDQTVTPTATLFACHPLYSAAYRYVVHLALAPS
jgi:sortase A